MNKSVQALRAAALAFPETQEGIVCNKSSFKARNKGFFFLGVEDDTYNVMVKLKDSLAEAEKLAAKDPDRYYVGANGWVKATFAINQLAPAGLLERWIEESYRLLVHKDLVAMLPDAGKSTTKKPAKPKKRRSK